MRLTSNFLSLPFHKDTKRMPLAHSSMPLRITYKHVCLLWGCCLAGLFLFQFIGFALAALFWEDTATLYHHLEYLSGDRKKLQYTLLWTEACTSLGGFVVAPLMYIRWIEKRAWKSLSFFNIKPVPIYEIALFLALLGSFMIFNARVIDWNEHIIPSEYESSLLDWIRNQEIRMQQLTHILTDMNDTWDLFLVLSIVAALAAVGEELFFRGCMQTQFAAIFSNTHLAVWVTATIFSIVHLQFYGFFPRLCMGALFGYLFAYSGNLWPAICAHFINNGLLIVLLYSGIYGTSFLELRENTTLPHHGLSIGAGLMTVILLTIFALLRRRRLKAPAAKWVSLFSTPHLQRAEIVKSILLSHNIHVVILNQRDTSYNIGYYELRVSSSEYQRAQDIIDQKVQFHA